MLFRSGTARVKQSASSLYGRRLIPCVDEREGALPPVMACAARRRALLASATFAPTRARSDVLAGQLFSKRLRQLAVAGSRHAMHPRAVAGRAHRLQHFLAAVRDVFGPRRDECDGRSDHKQARQLEGNWRFDYRQDGAIQIAGAQRGRAAAGVPCDRSGVTPWTTPA